MNAAAQIQDFSELAYANGRPRCSGLLKAKPIDFKVEEIIGFEFTGSGEHLCLQIKKTDLTTNQVAKTIANVFKVRLSEVGYAGLKDRRAISTQWFSVPIKTDKEVDVSAIESEKISVVEVARNDRKIRRGSHQANRFTVRLCEIQGQQSDLQSRVNLIKNHGVPNYFGQQRFGKAMANVQRALDFFNGNDSKRTGNDRFRKSMLLSAARSFLFNQILSRRVTENTWSSNLPGEVLNLDGSNSFFVDDSGSDLNLPGNQENIIDRLNRFDIHPTGLLFGKDSVKDPYLAGASVTELEKDVLNRYPALCRGLLNNRVNSSRRALRLIPREFESRCIDPKTTELKMTLTSGGYATSVLREICLTEEPELETELET